MYQFLWKFLWHIGNLRPLGRCWHTCVKSTSVQSWAKLSKYMGEWGGQYLSFCKGPMHHILFWKFLRHIETFQDHLGDVDIPLVRVLMPNTGLNWANTCGSGEVNISASISTPCTNFLEVSETQVNMFRPLGRCWHMHGQSVSAQYWDKLRKYMGEMGVNISASVMAPCTKCYFEVPEIHRNISRPLGRCWHTCRQSASTQNWAKLSKYMGEIERSISQLLLGPYAPIFWKILWHIGIF